ncbi:MAG: hypothetical protein K2P17_05175 [Helicobacteraceae bacterium]|nr:hypothetical protein [Helicobacteraceae bacterium]
MEDIKTTLGGGAIGDRYNDFQSSKHKWLQHYKFNICFENASYNGYLTEKLFDAFAAGCIPIYWGDTSLILDSADSSVNVESKNIESNFLLKPDYQINPKAFINIHKFASLEDAIDEIKRIDNDDNAYLEMANENVFLGDFSPNVYERRLEGFLLNIFNQNLQNAFRRGVSALYDNEMRYRKMAATFEGKSKRVKKLIRFICNITKTKKAFWG